MSQPNLLRNGGPPSRGRPLPAPSQNRSAPSFGTHSSPAVGTPPPYRPPPGAHSGGGQRLGSSGPTIATNSSLRSSGPTSHSAPPSPVSGRAGPSGRGGRGGRGGSAIGGSSLRSYDGGYDSSVSSDGYEDSRGPPSPGYSQSAYAHQPNYVHEPPSYSIQATPPSKESTPHRRSIWKSKSDIPESVREEEELWVVVDPEKEYLKAKLREMEIEKAEKKVKKEKKKEKEQHKEHKEHKQHSRSGSEVGRTSTGAIESVDCPNCGVHGPVQYLRKRKLLAGGIGLTALGVAATPFFIIPGLVVASSGIALIAAPSKKRRFACHSCGAVYNIHTKRPNTKKKTGN